MAAILFADVVSYSTLSSVRQRIVAQGLNEECARFLLPEFRSQRLRSEGSTMISAMPTGDGMVICLAGTTNAENDGYRLLSLARRLNEWATTMKIALRMGIHSGDLEIIEDVNQQRNFCGHAINIAQRIMDCGSGGHMLCSEDAYNNYFQDHDRHTVDSDLVFKLLPTRYGLKHGLEISLYNVRTESGTNGFGNADDPPVKSTYQVLSPRQQQGFLRRVLSNELITVVGVTNNRVVEALIELYDSGETSWKRVDFFYAANRLMEFIPKEEKILGESGTFDVHNFDPARLVEEKNRSIDRLQTLNRKLEIGMYEYKLPPIVGVVAGDYNKPNGVIQLNYYVWGRALSSCPTLVLEPEGSAGVYQAYASYLGLLFRDKAKIRVSGGAAKKGARQRR